MGMHIIHKGLLYTRLHGIFLSYWFEKKTTLLHKSIEHALYWRIHESLGLDSFSIRTEQENPIILALNFSQQFELYQWQLQWLHVKSGPTVG